MRTRSTSEPSHGNAAKPFFSVQRAPASAFFSPAPFALAAKTELESGQGAGTERDEPLALNVELDVRDCLPAVDAGDAGGNLVARTDLHRNGS